MKRPELVLVLIVLAFGAFVAREAVKAPKPASAQPDSVAPVVRRVRDFAGAPPPAPDPGAAAGHERVDMRFTADARRSAEALEDTRRRLRLGGPGTWIADVLAERDSTLLRWRARDAEPLRVWIAPARDVANRRPTFDRLVRDAFDDWAAAGAPVRITYVRDSASADVPVTWVDRFPDDRVGVTAVRGLNGELTWGAVTLATHTRHGEPLDEAWVRAIALHDVGHLLGLAHAASDTGSVMRPEAALRGLSRQDRSTMRLLYMLPYGSIR